MASSATSRAQQAHLDDVIASALGNNLALKREEVKVRAAAGEVREAAGAFDWTPTVETGWERLYVPLGVNGILTTRTDTVDAWKTTTAIGRTFRNGIEIQPGVTFYKNVGGVSSGQSLGQTTSLPSLHLKIPLLQGLGEDVAGAEEQATQKGLKGSQLHHEFVMQQVVHDTVQAFWKCRGVIEQQQIAEDASRNAANYVGWLRLMTSRGQVEPIMEQTAEADQTSRQIRLGRGAEAIEACRRELLIVSGGAEDSPPTPVGELPEPDKIGPSIAHLNQDAMINQALAQRLDLRALERLVEAQSVRLHAAEDGTLPKVDLFVDTNKVFLRYSQDLAGNIAQGRISKAKAAENQAQLNVTELRRGIRQDVVGTVSALRLAWLNWKTLSDNQIKLEASLAIRDKQAKAGLIGRDQVLAAQDVLTQIRHERLEARLQVASAIATLRLAVGMIEVEGRSPHAIATDFFVLPSP
jgi:outer membrane protein TolC